MNRKYTFKLIICLLAIIGLNGVIHAQRFGGGLELSANASQIDGDFSAGYNRIGFNAALIGIIHINPRTDIHAGLSYSSRGALSSFLAYSQQQHTHIALQYIDVPISVRLKDWFQESDYYKIHYYAGISVGRLFDSSVRSGGFAIPSEGYNRTDFGWLAGISYFFNAQTAFFIQYNRSFNLLYNKNSTPGASFNSMRGYYISLGVHVQTKSNYQD